MKTIVCHTQVRAVTEYTGFGFQSVTATRAGSATGLFSLGGDTDAGRPIVANLRLPRTLRNNTLKTHIDMVYLSMAGHGNASFTVHTPDNEWSYSFPLRIAQQTRCEVGKGIRENYLGFSLTTPAGQRFELDRIEVLERESKTRRV